MKATPPTIPASATDESTDTPGAAPDAPAPAVGFSGVELGLIGAESVVTVVRGTLCAGGRLTEGALVCEGGGDNVGDGVTLVLVLPGAPPLEEKKIDCEPPPPAGRLMLPPLVAVAIPPTAETVNDWTGSPTWKHWSSISVFRHGSRLPGGTR